MKISWLERPLLRFAVSLSLTIAATVLIANLVHVLQYRGWHGGWPDRFLIATAETYWSTIVITLIISLFMHGRGFLLQYKAAIMEQEELKRAHLASRYESLQNQVNPHFLFNSLNVLSNLIHQDVELADRFIQQMSRVYRYVLESRDRQVVSLARELEMLEAYLFLLRIRFGEALHMRVEVEPREGESVPPLCLQMLIENAVKHNVVARKRPLFILLRREEDDRILVENNRQAKEQVQHSLGIGLDNIRERFRHLAPGEVIIREEPDRFAVSLPIIHLNGKRDESPDR